MLFVWAVLGFLQLWDTEITEFHHRTTITAPAVAIHYNASDVSNYPVSKGDNQTWSCAMHFVNSTSAYVDITVVKESHKGDTCSSVGWTASKEEFLPCSTAFRYRSTSILLQQVNVRVNDGARLPNGWAVIRSRDGRNITVTCGNLEETTTALSASSTRISPSTSRSSLSSASTEEKPVTLTFASHEYSEVTSQATSTGDPLSPEVTSAAASAERENQRENGGEDNTWTVVGAVLALVAGLVAAAVAVFCFLRRRKLTPRTFVKPPSNRKSSLRMPMTPVTPDKPSTSQTLEDMGEGSSGGCPSATHNPAFLTAMDELRTRKAHADGQENKNSVEIPDESRGQHAHTTVPGLHGNTRSAEEDPDYDLLGQKKSQSSSSNPAATYGRLGEVGGGGEDTDYSYDHLARGRQAVPDVINSDYDTAALHVTSEDDYNRVNFKGKKQDVITGSDYDTAEIKTSEGDYNRVDFQGKRQHVITGSDYDTAEIVTSEGHYNRVNFQGKKQHVITGSDYDTAEIVISDD